MPSSEVRDLRQLLLQFFMSGAPVWRVPIRVVVNALSPNSL
jgi:hypothetical protein